MAEGKGKTIALWVLTALLAATFGMAGVTKLAGAQEAVEGFNKMGYSPAFRLFIGAAELAGAIGLLIPRLATAAAVGLAIIMAGAVYVTVAGGEARHAAAPAILLILLGVVGYARRDRLLGRGG